MSDGVLFGFVGVALLALTALVAVEMSISADRIEELERQAEACQLAVRFGDWSYIEEECG